MSGPLSSLKILDFSTLLPGPFASLLLADMGAEVLRVESPTRMDLVRVLPPHDGGTSTSHAYLNRNKRSIALDLKRPEAVEVVKQLVSEYDIVLEQFRPGVMDKLGVERRLLTAGENKGMLDPFSPADARQTAFAKAMLAQIHQQFIAVVREGRGARLKETPETFSGLFWNGEEAVKLGLADHFGTLDYVAREVVKAEEVIDYTPQENVAERLAKRFGASIGASAVRALRSLSPVR